MTIRHQFSCVSLVYISHLDQHKLLKIYYTNHINFLSVRANSAQKSFKHTCPGFDPVTPLGRTHNRTFNSKLR